MRSETDDTKTQNVSNCASEHALLHYYDCLLEKTTKMSQYAEANDWDAFMRIESESIAIMDAIQMMDGKVDLSTKTKEELVGVITKILKLHTASTKKTTDYRASLVQKMSAEATSIKVKSAYTE